MSQYLILIYEDEKGYAEGGDAAWVIGHGGPWPVRGAGRRARRQDRGRQRPGADPDGDLVRGDVVTDGPFAETKEALGGYYLIEATDLDQALEIAKLCPAPFGGVEVRPIMEFPDE